MANTDFVSEFFGPSGALAREFPGYQPRIGQLEGAVAAKRCIDEDSAIAIEAPTGTGKSLLYLVATIRSLQEKKGSVDNRAIVVTSNIALQEQLITMDLPLLAKLMPTVTFALAKGFQNYACKAMLDTVKEDRARNVRLPMFEDDRQMTQVLEWSEKTEKGDFSELPFELSWEVKRQTSIPSEECAGKRCLHYDACHPRTARKLWKSVDVIVTNYSLYMIDLVAKKSGGHGPLPTHRIALLDEAHAAPDAARAHFARKASIASTKSLVAELDGSGKRAKKLDLHPINPDLKGRAIVEAGRFFDELARVRQSRDYRARLDIAGMFDGADFQMVMHQCAEAYLNAAKESRLLPEAREFLVNRSVKCQQVSELVAEARGVSQDGWVYYIEESGKGRYELVAEPVSAGPFLKKSLFADDDDPPHAIVMCSATLAGAVNRRTGQPDFSFFQREMGCDGIATSLAVESPFDFSNVEVVVPKTFPDPSKDRDRFKASVSRALVDFVRQVDGGVLALFTSYDGLRAAHQELTRAGTGRSILMQGEQPRTQLVDRMRREPGTVVLGTDSFWEGVDVQGEGLVGLFIDKLPFENAKDPVLDARKTEDPKGWFGGYYLPKAVRKLKQGFGRLVRTTSDYGVVMICDNRIETSSSYGRDFRGALPKAVKWSSDPSKVGEILRRLRAQRQAA